MGRVETILLSGKAGKCSVHTQFQDRALFLSALNIIFLHSFFLDFIPPPHVPLAIMGSIEGVIILSSSNEPILNSHFIHPLANYPSLHADRLVEKLEASSSEKEKVGNSSKDVLPVVFVDDIPLVQEEETDGQDDEEGKETDSEWQTSNGKNTRNGAGLVHIEHNKLRFIATFSKQVDPLLPLTFLHSLLANLELYLGSPLTEESIRENFDVVYQMLEEMLDESGHPLNTEYNTLRELVREPSWIDGIVSKLGSAVSK